MVTFASLKAQHVHLLNRWHAWRATRGGGDVKGFVSSPEPRTIGSFARGKQLLSGNYLFSGTLLHAPDFSLWDLTPPDLNYARDLHGFAWMDDLAAVGDGEARGRAQSWLWGWIANHGTGTGPGWTPDLTGRRLIRWINHALFLLRGRDAAQSHAFYLSLEQQTLFLYKRWRATAPGLPRFEALTGLIYASLSLEGQEELAEPALKALARECATQIDAQGGLATRNPEELLLVFTLLTWAATALRDVGRSARGEHLAAIERIAPTLRHLRHADGSLARFHGGGRGNEGWLDQALAASEVRSNPVDGLAMGYARLSAGRSTIVIDAAPTPEGSASFNAHASTLAFELTSGRRALIVNCGSGASFGRAWRHAGRATPSHSTLSLDGFSSASLSAPERYTGQEQLINGPRNVPIEFSRTTEGHQFQGAHDGYVAAYGLTHARTLLLSPDGRSLRGDDMLLAMEEKDKRRFDRELDASTLKGFRFDVRFHLHPDVDATVDMGGMAVSLGLKSGEIWIFKQEGKHHLRLEDSVYLDTKRLKPRGSRQIVISGKALGYATRISWSLSKARETAIGVRDLSRDAPLLAEDE